MTWGVLLALATAALLDVVPLTETARSVVAFAALVAVVALSIWTDLRFKGTLLATSFAPSRFAVAIIGVSMAFLLANFPESVGLPARIGLVLVAPVLMVALLAWDDADTVKKLREQSGTRPGDTGAAAGQA